MPRIVYLGLFIVVAAIPFLFFGGLSSGSTSDDGVYRSGYRSGYYNRGPSFMFMHFGGGGGYRRSRGRSTGRGFSSGGFQGGGFRSGK